MKTYLLFSVEGEISEHKTRSTTFHNEEYTNYNFIEKIGNDGNSGNNGNDSNNGNSGNKNMFVILFNKNISDLVNITVLPFYDKQIYGEFLLFRIDSENNLKSLTENKFIKLLNRAPKKIEDYSSEDFNLSDDVTLSD